MNHLSAAMQQWPLSLHATTFAIITAFFLFFFFKIHKKKATLHFPPSPPGLPIVGNLHQLGSLPHRPLQALSKKYGPIMLLHFGYVPTIVVSSKEIAREVMKTHDSIFASRPFSSVANRLLYGSTDVAFAPYGEYWRHVKRICVVQLLSLKRVQSFRSIREEEISLFAQRIRKSCDRPVKLSEMIINLTNNIICRVALGKTYFGEEGYDFGGMMRELLYLLGSFPVRDFIPPLGWIDYLCGFDARVTRNSKEMDSFLTKVVDELLHAKANSSNNDDTGNNFADVLVSLKDDTANISISNDNIKAIILDMFIAGTDTTFSIIEWAMAELIRNPKVMKRAQEEVQQVIGCEGELTEESIDRMKYLKAIIKEAFRLHPPGPLLVPRETTKDIKLHGYDILAGTRVIINAWAIGRDPRSWDKPEEFDPERFMNSDINFKGHDFQLIPFGAGRRICPGLEFAMAIIELTVVHLLHHFDWELPNGMKGEELDMSESPGISIRKRSGLVLVARPRLH